MSSSRVRVAGGLSPAGRIASMRSKYGGLASIGKGDPEAVRAAIAKAQQEGDEILKKVNVVTDVSKEQKKKTVLSKHKFNWTEEARSLQNQRNEIEREMEASMRQLSYKIPEFTDMLYEEEAMRSNRLDLTQDLLHEVRQMRGKLGMENVKQSVFKIWLQQYKNRLDAGSNQLLSEEMDVESELNELRPNLATNTSSSFLDLNMEEATEIGDGGGDVVDGALRNEYVDRFINLYERCLAQLDNIRTEYLSACSCIFSVEANTSEEEEDKLAELAESPTGGWDETTHFHFAKIVKACQSREVSDRSSFFQRLQLELPQIPLEDLRKHDEWYSRWRWAKKKRAAVSKMWEKEKNDLVVEARQAFKKSAKEAEIALEKDVEALKIEQKKDKLHKNLDHLRDQKREEEHNQRIQHQMREQEKILHETRLKEKQAKQRSLAKQKVLSYHEQQQEKKRRDEELKARERLDKEARHIIESQTNRRRVKYRETEQRQKELQRQQKEEELRREKEEQQKRLDRLAATVKVNVKEDPNRVYQATEASKAESEKDKKLFRVDGYTTKELMKDYRFKLNMALRDAGLHNTDYGSTVLRRAHRIEAPKHMVSHVPML